MEDFQGFHLRRVGIYAILKKEFCSVSSGARHAFASKTEKERKETMKKKTLSLALALVLSLGMFTLGALAASGTRTLEVTYKDIKLVIDGQEVVPKDAAGNVVEPFQANGTTYLPVRAVGEALGKEVTWDGNANTVYIGSAVHLPYQVNSAILYDGSDASASFAVAGKSYTRGVVLQSYHNTNAGNDEQRGVDGDAIWNTEGFQTMTFTVGHVGDVQFNGTVFVALDGRAAGEYQVQWDGSPQTITVPLGGSPNVKLTLVADPADNPSIGWDSLINFGAHYGVYDVKLS